MSNPPSTIRDLRLALALALLAVVLGALLGYAGPIITVALVLAIGLAALALSNLEVGMWGVIAVITLLPWGALPVKLVLTPTLLDLALAGVVLTYLVQWMTGSRRRLATTPVHGPILAFILLAVFSFVAGLRNGPLTPNLIRHFAELLLSVGMAFLIVDIYASREKLARLALVIMLCGAGAALIGIALYALPEALSEGLLSGLAVFNYPSGGVLRYLEDNPDLPQRAISTSVDPNVLGGLLAMVGGLMAPKVFAPGWRRPGWWLAFGAVLICLVLTYSRGAMLALAVALFGIALAKYRRILLILAFAGAVLLLLPATQTYVGRFVEGAQGQDLATQMRFGEYGDALTLISRYPLGVGFAAAPDIDIYLGVSSAYLLMAEAVGFPGLAAFLAVAGAAFFWAFLRRREALSDPALAPLWLGAHAGLAAALVVGVFDHYFFNIDFQPASAIFWIFVGLSLAATRLASSK